MLLAAHLRMPYPESLRIALFTYATQPRGGVLHALALGEALHDLGHDVVLHALDDSGRGFIREPRCSYKLTPVDAVRDDMLPYVRRRIAALVRSWNPLTPAFDVYHAHDGISGNALATLAESGRIPGYFRTVHHLDDFGASPLGVLQDRSVVRAGGCLAVSRLWRERLAKMYGIDATVVPNGVDNARFSAIDPALRECLRAASGYAPGPLFVTVGGIEARKNSVATLEAFALVLETHPTARLVIAGGASIFNHSAYRRAFDARAAELRLGEDGRIVFAGVLTDAQIVTLLRAAHAFVFPSLVEGFGLVVLEALACGTPVVTSAIPPFTEYLGAADALLVDPCDSRAIAAAMMRALRTGVATAAASNGPIVARRFGWDASARAHLRAYTAMRTKETELAYA